jgi:hypothetical protein
MIQEGKETVREMIPQFINNHADTQLKTDLLFFWNRYPYANFTAGVIARAVNCVRKADVEEALEVLVTDELIEKHTHQGQPFYCLTADPEKREPILRLSACSGGCPSVSAHGRRQRITNSCLKKQLRPRTCK